MRNNQLWFGDNLTILREEIADDSVDLVYLDPPFNSDANYNVLFRTPDDVAASAQVEAFRDTWSWGPEAQWSLGEIMRSGGNVAAIVGALHTALGDSDMMAYLVMMAQRLDELHRVLKPEGSLYLHCDPTASHYLKIILDAVFGATYYRSEVSWRRTSAHNDAKQGRKNYGHVRDVILFYGPARNLTWNTQYSEYSTEYVEAFYRHIEPGSGRRYRLDNLTAAKPGGDVSYEWRVKRQNGGDWHADVEDEWRMPRNGWEYKGKPPYNNRYWAYSHANMVELEKKGLIGYTSGGMPNFKRYLDEQPGVALQDDWQDIKPRGQSESLGYPTQKPQSLLERIIAVSSDPGQVILDPFCGCGTTVAAAQMLDRQWIGIDVAYHAIRVIEDRLADQGKPVEYDLGGIPRDFESAIALAEKDKYQFQWWANYLVGVQALKEVKRGPDRGIDGQMFFMNGPGGWGRVLTSVKGGRNVRVSDVREFRAVIERENAEMGLFICLRAPTREMQREADSFGNVQTVHGYLPRLQIVTIERWFQGDRPVLPTLGHVAREWFNPKAKKKRGKQRTVDPNAPEFPFSFPGGKNKDVVVHINPATVPSEEVG